MADPTPPPASASKLAKWTQPPAQQQPLKPNPRNYEKPTTAKLGLARSD